VNLEHERYLRSKLPKELQRICYWCSPLEAAVRRKKEWGRGRHKSAVKGARNPWDIDPDHDPTIPFTYKLHYHSELEYPELFEGWKTPIICPFCGELLYYNIRVKCHRCNNFIKVIKRPGTCRLCGGEVSIEQMASRGHFARAKLRRTGVYPLGPFCSVTCKNKSRIRKKHHDHDTRMD